MHKLSRIVAALAVLMCLPASLVWAQTATDSAVPAAPNTASDKAPAPAPSATPAADSTPTESKKTSTEPTPAPKKRKATRMTRRQEIDRSIDSGTVPARYRSSVPKEYQHYIPFAK